VSKAASVAPGESLRTCCVCGTPITAAKSRVDTTGRSFCDLCFDDLRAQPPEEADPDAPVAIFRCAVCGAENPATALRTLAGQLVCENCVSQKNAGIPASEEDAGEPQADSDAAEEAKQIVANLNGSLPSNLLPQITCPHCWHVFGPDKLLRVSQHAELLGDPVLGPEEHARFLPSRFNVEGEALDARDMPCQLLACPRCHLIIPPALVEVTPLFVSVIGAPASGKSHLLASMSWELRRVLRDRFSITFNDADAFSNLSLHRYEETLFVPHDKNSLVTIRKTELQGELYDQIRMGQQIVSLPRPFLFTLRPQPKVIGINGANGEHHAASERLRVMCLYDNAGEHFQPGMDTASAPGTQHLAKSKVLIFLFDPTQHPSFREKCKAFSQDPQLYGPARTLRQETILTEAANRVRRYTGLSPQKKHERPLLVVVSKADVWAPLLDADLNIEPILPDPAYPDTDMALVDVKRIEKTSKLLREMLVKLTPEVVAAAEDFCKNIVYIPSSALGRGPELQQETGMLGIRPRDIHPKWAAVPILYLFAKWAGGMLAAARPVQRAVR
jgi:hypothetical protein